MEDKAPPVSTESYCESCGIPWEKHPGIAGTCKRLGNLRAILRNIYELAWQWDGVFLQPDHVEKICRKALEDTR